MDHFYQPHRLGPPTSPCSRPTPRWAPWPPHRPGATRHAGHRRTYRNPDAAGQASPPSTSSARAAPSWASAPAGTSQNTTNLGYDFGTFTDRFNRLDESLQIILPMLAGERPTFEGAYYRTKEAMAEPRFRDHIPLMIGGSGEKKTIPLAVKHFDHLNIIAGFDELPRKVQVVRDRCEQIGRDPPHAGDQHARHRHHRREHRRRLRSRGLPAAGRCSAAPIRSPTRSRPRCSTRASTASWLTPLTEPERVRAGQEPRRLAGLKPIPRGVSLCRRWVISPRSGERLPLT